MRIKDYLSFSQYSTFLRSERQYIKTYLEGVRLESKYLSFGGKFAKAIEEGTGDRQFLEVIKKLPIPKEREKKLLVEFEGIPLLGIMDGFTKGNKSKEYIIDEYKTGKVAWTQRKVDKHEQLTFYAIMVWIKYKVKIEKIRIRLHWLETKEDINGELYFTGKVECFETRRNMTDVIRFYPKLKEAWEGIEKLVDEYLLSN